MNIFVLDLDPKKCAQYHCDKHVVKMIVETAQLLSTAHHVNGVNLALEGMLYKKTHVNHPCAIWARKSLENYLWLSRLGLELIDEYRIRYGKWHKTFDLMVLLSDYIPMYFQDKYITQRPLCMPDKYKQSDPVFAYRDYYKNEKRSILQYKTKIPDFLK
jgi:arylsulfatase A-like enzyme